MPWRRHWILPSGASRSWAALPWTLCAAISTWHVRPSVLSNTWPSRASAAPAASSRAAAPLCSALLPCLVAPRCFLVAPRSCSLRSAALAVLHYLGWKPSNPQVWNDATLDVFENRGILPVSDWTGECCFVGIRESFVSQLFVQGTSWGQQLENKSEEERPAVRKKFLTQCGANLTSPGLSVHSGALVRVLVFVHHNAIILISGRRIVRKRQST